MTANLLQAWVSIALSTVTLLSVAFGVLKVMNQSRAEWKLWELRIQIIETDVVALKAAAADLSGIKVKLSGIADEVSKIGDRLDRFLDGPRLSARP